MKRLFALTIILVPVMSLLISLSCLSMMRLNQIEVRASDSYPVHNLNSGLDYATIQEAINANDTSDGDTLFCDQGSYQETDITVNKSLRIVGEDWRNGSNSSTVLNGMETGQRCFSVVVSNVQIENFVIKDFTHSGIFCIGDKLHMYYTRNVTVENCKFVTDNSAGMTAVEFWECSSCTVINCTIEGGSTGIYLLYTTDTNITMNTITGSGMGIWIYDGSSYNLVEGNIVENSASYGIELNGVSRSESFNIVRNNSIVSCGWDEGRAGIAVFQKAPYTKIYHNNLFGNYQNALDYSLHTEWDDGYPSGGNCWSGYSRSDYYKGPFQNETGSDGIGDIPYTIATNGVDRYPVMKPNMIPEFPSALILPLFMMATLLAAMIYTKKHMHVR